MTINEIIEQQKKNTISNTHHNFSEIVIKTTPQQMLNKHQLDRGTLIINHKTQLHHGYNNHRTSKQRHT